MNEVMRAYATSGSFCFLAGTMPNMAGTPGNGCSRVGHSVIKKFHAVVIKRATRSGNRELVGTFMTLFRYTEVRYGSNITPHQWRVLCRYRLSITHGPVRPWQRTLLCCNRSLNSVFLSNLTCNRTRRAYQKVRMKMVYLTSSRLAEHALKQKCLCIAPDFPRLICSGYGDLSYSECPIFPSTW